MSRQLASLSTKEAIFRNPGHRKGWEEEDNLFWRPIFHHAAGFDKEFDQRKNDLLPWLCNPRGWSDYLLLNIRTSPRPSGIGNIGNVTRSNAVDRPAGISLDSKGCAQLWATGIVALFWGILHASIRLTTGNSRLTPEKGSPSP